MLRRTVHLTRAARLVVAALAPAVVAVTLAAPAPGASAAAPAAVRPAPRPATAGSAGFSHVANPRMNVAPQPNYLPACWANGDPAGKQSADCRTQSLAAINNAHALEHVRPITLPKNFWSQPAVQQVFIITNLERVSRGLKPVAGLTPQAQSWAQSGAARNADPMPASRRLSSGAQLTGYGSIWAADYNVLDADYAWMYRDGWGGSRKTTSNIDCTSATAASCWGHRQIILGYYGGSGALVSGTGTVPAGWGGYFNSDAQLFLAYVGKQPPLVYTWSTAVKAGAH
jgi:hypothetical protein